MNYYSILSLSAAVFISQLFVKNSWSNIFFGKDDSLYPLSIQNITWVVFFIGLIKIIKHSNKLSVATKKSKKQFLKFKEGILLNQQKMDLVLSKIQEKDSIYSTILFDLSNQFKFSNSVSNTKESLAMKINLLQHELEIENSLVKYLIWLIPTIGFLGTVYGISQAIHAFGTIDSSDPNILLIVTSKLSIAFHTTIVSLILSSLLYFMENKEQYRIDTFINELYKRIRQDFADKLVENDQ
jgi:biopolymer transport protein ExbB/TolQ